MYNTHDILNEVYFGKNKNILKVEQLFSELKKQMEVDKETNYNKSKELMQIREILAKEFGFETVSLNINPIYSQVNGYTIKFFYNKNVKQSVDGLKQVTSATGIRYKDPKDKKVYIEFNAGALTEGPIGNVMALLLHEIGHNFYVTRTGWQFARYSDMMDSYFDYIKEFKIKLASGQLSPLDIIKQMKNIAKFSNMLKGFSSQAFKDEDGNLVADPRTFDEYIIALEKWINAYFEDLRKADERNKSRQADREAKKDSKLRNMMIKIGRALSMPFDFLGMVLFPLSVSGAKNNNELLNARDDEKFSDNFAASFGYGPELAGLNKNWMREYDDFMDLHVKFRAKAKVFNMWSYMVAADEHPTCLERIRFMKKKIEHELANEKLSPAAKKELKEQLNKIVGILEMDKSEFERIQLELEAKHGNVESQLDEYTTKDENLFDFDTKFQQKYKEPAGKVKKEEVSIDEELDTLLESFIIE